MKKILASFLLLACLHANAQWALDLTNYNVPLGNESISVINNPSPGSIAIPVMGGNQTWDYGSIPLGTANTVYYFAGGIGTFPNATYIEDSVGGYSGSGQRLFSGKLIHQIDNQGDIVLGEYLEKQKVCLQPTTANVNDSISFPQQTLNLGYRKLIFPCFFGFSWADTFNATLDFQIKLGSMYPQYTSGMTKVKEIHNSEVVGWGKMRVPLPNGGASTFYDVMLIHLKMSEQDSFFVGGQPVTTQFLNSLFLTQATYSDYFTLAIRANEKQPLATFYHGADASYSNIYRVSFHTSNTSAFGTNIETQTLAQQVKLYPNPAQNHAFNLHFAQNTSEEAKAKVVNHLGQVVYEFTLSPNEMQAETNIQLPQTLKTGIYTLNIQLENEVLNKVFVLE